MSRPGFIAVAAGVAGGLALAIVAAVRIADRTLHGPSARPASVAHRDRAAARSALAERWRGAERILLQGLADRWTVSLREHAEHWAAVYPLTWRA
jgi:hypothetical protein